MILDNNWLVYRVYQFINSFSFYRVMTYIDAENVKFWLCSFVSSQNMIFFPLDFIWVRKKRMAKIMKEKLGNMREWDYMTKKYDKSLSKKKKKKEKKRRRRRKYYKSTTMILKPISYWEKKLRQSNVLNPEKLQ